MQEEITTGELIRVWWCFVWRFFVGSVVLGFIAGFVIGVVGTVTHLLEPGGLQEVARITGIVISILWSFVVLFMALNKKYRGFRIAIVRGDLPLCRME